ncbi:hypothetical protein [Pseudoalteromonas sp. SR41-6]|uniref:hypothetical protein n=1 Tax=Pseudoalteromonas sp. SR41-6 TaxID=2760948 RepID=UPI0016024E8A|nr:hypothetical protein [Pseudoalteromonas sp. SR41-6]MBB1334020.1 hypothetical protein [Pseudoalteromonas sp. SR41-6]
MKLVFTVFLIFILNGCSSIKKSDDRYIHYTKGGESIEAYTKNPLLDCEHQPKIARLDKKFIDRVFINENGDLCK